MFDEPEPEVYRKGEDYDLAPQHDIHEGVEDARGIVGRRQVVKVPEGVGTCDDSYGDGAEHYAYEQSDEYGLRYLRLLEEDRPEGHEEHGTCRPEEHGVGEIDGYLLVKHDIERIEADQLP